MARQTDCIGGKSIWSRARTWVVGELATVVTVVELPLLLMTASLGLGIGCSPSGPPTALATANPAPTPPSVVAPPIRPTTVATRSRAAEPGDSATPPGAGEAVEAAEADDPAAEADVATGRPVWQILGANEDRQATATRLTTVLWNGHVAMTVAASPGLASWYVFAARTDPCYVTRSGRGSTTTRCDVEVTRAEVPVADGGTAPPGADTAQAASPSRGRGAPAGPPAAPDLEVTCVNARGAVVLFDRSETAPRVATSPTAIRPGSKALVQVSELRSCWLHGGTTLLFSATATQPRRSRPREASYDNDYGY